LTSASRLGAEKRRVYLIDIDLRWGVTREQVENDQALDFCLQQIDECRPFFIGILGDRYGWVPTRYPAYALKKFGWIQQHTGKSVTELEILHGVLQNHLMRGRGQRPAPPSCPLRGDRCGRPRRGW
jgi:nephrocystin-3